MVVRILQIYSWVSWSQIMTHEPCDPSYVYDNFEKTVDQFFYKNTVTTIKSWIARRSNSNKSFAVLTLKASPYLSDGGGDTSRPCFPENGAVVPHGEGVWART